jgi:simple sugar transport system ATP-binding protein
MLKADDVRPANLRASARSFSGGNQQKLIIARELARSPRLVLAANPIRGVDVGAIEFIHSKLVAARDQGAGILLFSADLDEVLTLSDRILVLYEGTIVGQFERAQATREAIGVLMGGGHAAKTSSTSPARPESRSNL